VSVITSPCATGPSSALTAKLVTVWPEPIVMPLVIAVVSLVLVYGANSEKRDALIEPVFASVSFAKPPGYVPLVSVTPGAWFASRTIASHCSL
jgi:hypothetical protein